MPQPGAEIVVAVATAALVAFWLARAHDLPLEQQRTAPPWSPSWLASARSCSWPCRSRGGGLC